MAVYKIQNCTLLHFLYLYLRTINKEVDALWFFPGSAQSKLAGFYIPLGYLRTKQELNQSKENWARRLRTEEQIQEWEISLKSKIKKKETENGSKRGLGIKQATQRSETRDDIDLVRACELYMLGGIYRDSRGRYPESEGQDENWKEGKSLKTRQDCVSLTNSLK